MAASDDERVFEPLSCPPFICSAEVDKGEEEYVSAYPSWDSKNADR